jgi:excisionase family DNA binding protein
MKRCEVIEVEKQWFTTKDAMKYLGMSRDFFDGLRKSAEITYYQVGRIVFFNKHDLDKFMTKHKVV